MQWSVALLYAFYRNILIDCFWVLHCIGNLKVQSSIGLFCVFVTTSQLADLHNWCQSIRQSFNIFFFSARTYVLTGNQYFICPSRKFSLIWRRHYGWKFWRKFRNLLLLSSKVSLACHTRLLWHGTHFLLKDVHP